MYFTARSMYTDVVLQFAMYQHSLQFCFCTARCFPWGVT